MLASKEKPTVVMIVVSLENSEESETRYISGKTVAEVISELFGEKAEKVKKPRAKRRTRQEIEAAKEAPLGEEETPVEKKKKREPIFPPEEKD